MKIRTKKSIIFISFLTIATIGSAQQTGNWDVISGNAQTTTTKALGLNTTTPNARINLVNPVFCCNEAMQSYSHDPLHIQYNTLSTMLKLTNSGRLGLQISNPNSFFLSKCKSRF